MFSFSIPTDSANRRKAYQKFLILIVPHKAPVISQNVGGDVDCWFITFE